MAGVFRMEHTRKRSGVKKVSKKKPFKGYTDKWQDVHIHLFGTNKFEWCLSQNFPINRQDKRVSSILIESNGLDGGSKSERN